MPSFLVSTQHNPYLNIAVEQYLLTLPPTGDVTLYLWQNSRTVVIGQNQNPYAECDVAALENDGGYLMRRRTGGGAVFHDLGNLNFSFIVPNENYDTARQFNVLRQAVASYGLDTEVSGRNDVLCQGRKFSGNAFSRGKQQRLHHGTILIRTDVALLQRYLKVKPAKLQRHGVASVQSRVVNLSELNPDITAQDMVPRLYQAFEKEYGTPVEMLDFDTVIQCEEVQRQCVTFASEKWKYGRWREFRASRSAQFDWGGVELDFTVDEAQCRITDVAIASDSLFPDVIEKARLLLVGASTRSMPPLPGGEAGNSIEHQMISDILGMAYDSNNTTQ